MDAINDMFAKRLAQVFNYGKAAKQLAGVPVVLVNSKPLTKLSDVNPDLYAPDIFEQVFVAWCPNIAICGELLDTVKN